MFGKRLNESVCVYGIIISEFSDRIKAEKFSRETFSKYNCVVVTKSDVEFQVS